MDMVDAYAALTSQEKVDFKDQLLAEGEQGRQVMGVWAEMQEQAYAQGLAEGLAEGRAAARAETIRRLLTRVLNRRQLSLTPDFAAQVQACTDVAQLEAWYDRAIDAKTVAEIFADGASSVH
jgi:flagellar biosynthesis/type III secretory pathway protein FliH